MIGPTQAKGKECLSNIFVSYQFLFIQNLFQGCHLYFKKKIKKRRRRRRRGKRDTDLVPWCILRQAVELSGGAIVQASTHEASTHDKAEKQTGQ